jgi:hypothetical protein
LYISHNKLSTNSCLVGDSNNGVIKHEGSIRLVRLIFLLYMIRRELIYYSSGGGDGDKGVVVLLCVSERDVRRR